MSSFFIAIFPKNDNYTIIDPNNRKSISIFQMYKNLITENGENDTVDGTVPTKITEIKVDRAKNIEDQKSVNVEVPRERAGSIWSLKNNVLQYFLTEEESSISNKVKVSQLKSNKAFNWTLKDVFLHILTNHNIINDTWSVSRDGLRHQVLIVLNYNIVDKLMKDLISFGFGKIDSTSIGIIPTTFHEYVGNLAAERPKNVQQTDFFKSIRARLTVSEICDILSQNAVINFDKMMMITVAGNIAGIGLIFNDLVLIVAAMCVCPMMGPILAMAFGIAIRNKRMFRLGIRNEAIFLSLALFFSFLIGCSAAFICRTQALFGANKAWPTDVMSSIGRWSNLIGGLIIAFVSGIGIALSVLGGNVALLVGIAIATSILPPAVNSGMLFGHAFIWSMFPPLVTSIINPINGCNYYVNNIYSNYYTCTISLEMAILGTISLCLYLINVIFIILAALIAFKIKQITPTIFAQTASDIFFKRDIKLMKQEKSQMDDFFEVGLFSKKWLETYMMLKTKKEKSNYIDKWRKLVSQLNADALTPDVLNKLPNFQMMSRILMNPDVENIIKQMIAMENIERIQNLAEQLANDHPIYIILKFMELYKKATTTKEKEELIKDWNLVTDILISNKAVDPLLLEFQMILKEKNFKTIDTNLQTFHTKVDNLKKPRRKSVFFNK